MARPVKYDWEAIKEAYEGGLNVDDIALKYKVPKKHIRDKARVSEWVVNGAISDGVDEFYANVQKTAKNIEELHPNNQELVIQKINTIEADNELISNNRKIAKLLQSVIVSNRDAITLANIRNVSGTLKDIESIANPSKPMEINNNNAMQNVTEVIISEA